MINFSDIPGRVNNVVIERNYTSNSLTLFWDTVFSLDLTGIDPDIIYTVELFKITGDKNVFISGWDAAENTTSVRNLDLMQIYKVVIAARNNVPGARNGPSVVIRGRWHDLL